MEQGRMCPHNDFEIIYYRDGVMLRRCKDCRKIELHLEWIWAGIDEIKMAIDFSAEMENDDHR